MPSLYQSSIPSAIRVGLYVLLCATILGYSHGTRVYAESPYFVVLGVAQDGGYPQAGCSKQCCKPAWDNSDLRRFVSCIALVDPESGKRFLLDCTPDFRDQLRLLDSKSPSKQASGTLLDGIFPTHAHVGHYTGLMHLGREIMGAKSIPVYAMPRMKYFLESNGPWSQLVELNQIEVRRCAAGEAVQLTSNLSVTPFLVPHRDEFSETVGYRVDGPSQSLLYLPDIDKWERWGVSIESQIETVDYAFLDGTFFDAAELPGRDMSEIPHPFIRESIERFKKLSLADRKKIRFIHLNHSNPMLKQAVGLAADRDTTSSTRELLETGMTIARQGTKLPL